MATIRKQGKKWRAEIVRVLDSAKVRQSKTFVTRAEAKDWASAEETRLVSRQSNAASSDKLLLDIFTRYAREVSTMKKGERWEIMRLEAFKRDSISNVTLKKLSADHFSAYRDRRLKVVSASTVNREFTLMSHCIEVARKEWKWMVTNPLKDVRRPPSPRPRDQRIDDSDRDAICEALTWSQHKPPHNIKQQVAAAFCLCIETGLRAGEALALRWRDIHIAKRFLAVIESKNGDKRDIPLSPRAIEILNLMRLSDTSRDTVYTVTSASRDAIFRKCKPAHLQHIHFHDSRHEAVTRLSKKLDVLALARMIGHRDLRSLQTYYNESASEIALRL